MTEHTEHTEQLDLNERLRLIESMITEGRRVTGNWGWSFVLWGVAYFVAIAWSTLGRSSLAWPVTMVAAGGVTGVVASRRTRNHPRTGIGRAIGSIWLAMGVCCFVLMFSLAFSDRLDNHVSLAIVGSMLAVANGASSIILRWKMQLACAAVWLGAAEVGCFGSANQGMAVFLAATFFCQIVFGIYAMVTESRQRAQGAVHA